MPYIQDANYNNVVLLPPEVKLVHLSWMANDGLVSVWSYSGNMVLYRGI